MPETTKATARQVVAQVVGAGREADRPADPVRRDRRPGPGRAHPAPAAARHRLGRARSRPTSPTTCPSTARWCRSGWSATAGAGSPVEREVILAIDQSGSMAASVVYASVFGAVLASMRALRTSLSCSTPRSSTSPISCRRSGRPAVRHPARRRHRHQPGHRLLPVARHQAARHAVRADLGPVRGRRRATRCCAGSPRCTHAGVQVRGPARPVRRRGAVVRPGQRGGDSPAWGSPRSRAPPTRSPTCWPSHCAAATSPAGCRGTWPRRQEPVGPRRRPPGPDRSLGACSRMVRAALFARH